MSELAMFHRLIDRLNIPVFNALGSHDVEAFGNLMPTSNPHSDAECGTVASVAGGKADWLRTLPIGRKLCVSSRVRCSGADCKNIRLSELVAAGQNNEPITHDNARARFITGLQHRLGVEVPMPRGDAWDPPPRESATKSDVSGSGEREATPEEQEKARVRRIKEAWCSAQLGPHTSPWLHGFVPDPDHRENPGYYAFTSKLADIDDGAGRRNLISIVLDTEDLQPNEAGVRGRIQKTQMEWLKQVLGCVQPRDLVIVFSHVAISKIVTDVKGELEAVLRAHKPNVIAYFYGHDHVNQICGDNEAEREGVCTQFWEVETASLLEFPQEARRVKIKYVGKGMAFLELVAFRESLKNPDDELGRAIALARAAAQRDHCRTDADARCSDDERVYRTDGNDANARLWFKLP